MEVAMDPEASSAEIAQTYYCDIEHPSIRERASSLACQAVTVDQLARDTFLYVRDQFPFGFDLIKVKASETLHKGYGACFNKSLLLTALLRANGIPARFCSVPVSRWFMKPYIGLQCLLINHPFHHCLVQVQLDGQWSFAEPTLDRSTYETLYRPLGVKWGIDWSLARRDRLYQENLMGEPEIHQDIDLTINRNIDNFLLPAPLARAMCRHINRNAWKIIGIKAPA
jgi:transglutaminase-like putative cysteine protease